jgi:hypothetical protein
VATDWLVVSTLEIFFFFSFKPVNLELEKNIGLC